MIVVDNVTDLRRAVSGLRAARGRIAFVPTMGNLHSGHLRLMQVARGHAQAVVASIYVNPLQFGPTEDYAAYPRTPEADRRRLAEAGVELLFLPNDVAMYPRGLADMTQVEVPGLSDILCGAFRPGHFRGVATVVNRLFNLVGPHVALFGKKDYQQLQVIRRMVADLGLPIEIVGVETVREPDGLALSSRNHYLTAAERAIAPRLYETLVKLSERVARGGGALGEAEDDAASRLREAGFRPDYLTVRRQADLAPPGPADRDLVALAAAWLGSTRLIDNIEFRAAN